MSRIIIFLSLLLSASWHLSSVQAQTGSAEVNGKLVPIVHHLLAGGVAEKNVNAAITPSRTECASPCTVVFSAEKTRAVALDQHGVWSQLSYHWDFDTDQSDTYGSLYNQTYSYVDGDTAFEKGHVPMVTKTFLCATGTCIYNVGMRAQNLAGEYGDAFIAITVKAESTQWSAADTVCVSNTLNTSADWTDFEKACPAGATKQTVMPDGDQYSDRLVLMKRGDVFSGRGLATYTDQSNFKIGVFGNVADGRPELDAPMVLGVSNFNEGFTDSNFANYHNLSDAWVQQKGWPSNIYIEGLKLQQVMFPMSYQHVGLHDIDMDREAYSTGGNINVAGYTDFCYPHRPANSNFENLDCALVPFPKGGYISSVDIVGNSSERGPGLNMGQTECAMVNFLGITDTRVRRSYEHNIRIAGWYRFNMMRSSIRGQHNQPGASKNSKLTLRSCLDSGGDWERGVWASAPDLPTNWNVDVMNPDGSMRTRADSDSTNPLSGEFAHSSRYHVVAYNQIGDRTAPLGAVAGGGPYTSNLSFHFPVDLQLQVDLMVSHNTFERESTVDVSDVNQLNSVGYHDIQMHSSYGTCVANDYAPPTGTWCMARGEVIPPGVMPHFRNEPTPMIVPLTPGSN